MSDQLKSGMEPDVEEPKRVDVEGEYLHEVRKWRKYAPEKKVALKGAMSGDIRTPEERSAEREIRKAIERAAKAEERLRFANLSNKHANYRDPRPIVVSCGEYRERFANVEDAAKWAIKVAAETGKQPHVSAHKGRYVPSKHDGRGKDPIRARDTAERRMFKDMRKAEKECDFRVRFRRIDKRFPFPKQAAEFAAMLHAEYGYEPLIVHYGRKRFTRRVRSMEDLRPWINRFNIDTEGTNLSCVPS